MWRTEVFALCQVYRMYVCFNATFKYNYIINVKTIKILPDMSNTTDRLTICPIQLTDLQEEQSSCITPLAHPWWRIIIHTAHNWMPKWSQHCKLWSTNQNIPLKESPPDPTASPSITSWTTKPIKNHRSRLNQCIFPIIGAQKPSTSEEVSKCNKAAAKSSGKWSTRLPVCLLEPPSSQCTWVKANRGGKQTRETQKHVTKETDDFQVSHEYTQLQPWNTKRT